MSNQTIKQQIEAANEAAANEAWGEARRLVEALLERKLTKAQRAEVEKLSNSLPAGYSMASHIAKYRARYQRSVAASGAKSLNNGDALAKFLEYKDHNEVMKLADQFTPIDGQSHAERYERLNNGQKRMNAGNKLRAAVKKGELIVTESGIKAA